MKINIDLSLIKSTFFTLNSIKVFPLYLDYINSYCVCQFSPLTIQSNRFSNSMEETPSLLTFQSSKERLRQIAIKFRFFFTKNSQQIY